MTNTVSINNVALLWFQRSGMDDAAMKIWSEGKAYYVKYTDPALASGKHFQYVFYDYCKLVEYLDVFFKNMIIDGDYETPFQYVQWDIPGFSTSIVKLEDIDSDVVFGRFAGCLEFFFDNK